MPFKLNIKYKNYIQQYIKNFISIPQKFKVLRRISKMTKRKIKIFHIPSHLKEENEIDNKNIIEKTYEYIMIYTILIIY